VSVNDILRSGAFTDPPAPSDSWSLGTVSGAPSGGVASVVIDGDTAGTSMTMLVPCADGDRVLTVLLGRSRMVVGVIGAICPHAVGDYYMTESTTSPADRWPGTTWEELAGRVLVGRDSAQTEFDTVGEQGGHKAMQAHTHGLSLALYRYSNGSSSAHGSYYYDGMGGAAIVPTTTGTGDSENLQPYRVCYVWRRTA